MRKSLVIDSTAYLSEEEINRYAITVVPDGEFSGRFIYDGIVDAKDFSPASKKSAKLPFTSQPAVGAL